jgi:hypothetical protein
VKGQWALGQPHAILRAKVLTALVLFSRTRIRASLGAGMAQVEARAIRRGPHDLEDRQGVHV